MKGSKNRGRSCTRWPDGLKEARITKSLELRDAKVKCVDRDEWRDFMYSSNIDINI